MLHIFSRGDLDTGKAKFYACDGQDDFKEVPPNVPVGSEVLLLSTCEIYRMDETNNWQVSYTLAGGDVDFSGYVSKEVFDKTIAELRAEFSGHQEESTVWDTISN